CQLERSSQQVGLTFRTIDPKGVRKQCDQKFNRGHKRRQWHAPKNRAQSRSRLQAICGDGQDERAVENEGERVIRQIVLTRNERPKAPERQNVKSPNEKNEAATRSQDGIGSLLDE